MLSRKKIIETITNDSGELHPWTTWPTLHRGVNNELHRIQFINQPLKEASKYPPIWEILQKNGLNVGVFGSLQSYPPIKSKNISFYLPDTFAPTDDAYPKILKNFQSFNLTFQTLSNPGSSSNAFKGTKVAVNIGSLSL